MFFVGYNNPLSGNLREIARHTRAIAGAIAGRNDQRALNA
jgi:hypothetical protein